MARFRIKVTVIAQCDYEVEVNEDTESKAEDAALSQWHNKLPPDFVVDRTYVTDWETVSEQLTADCPECGIEHTIPSDATTQEEAASWNEDYEYCKPCGGKIEAQERADATR